MTMPSSRSAWPRRTATLGLLLTPLLLSACYVVPVAPAPGYRYHDRYYEPYPYPYRYHRYRGGYGQAAPAVDGSVQIELAGSSR